jgi:DNA-binding transcriptional ArsR family regulator
MEALTVSALPATTEANTIVLMARVFAGVSEPTRNELVDLTGVSQGRVSVHLQCLRQCGFVTSERHGKYVFYRVRDLRVQELIQQAQHLAFANSTELASCGVLNHEAQADQGK